MSKQEMPKFSSEAEKKSFGLYQHVAFKFMQANTEKDYNEPVYSKPSNYKFDAEKGTLVVEYEGMYNRPAITFAFLESLSETFRTKHINLENGHSMRGCDTCDYGSSYGVIITLKNVGVKFSES